MAGRTPREAKGRKKWKGQQKKRAWSQYRSFGLLVKRKFYKPRPSARRHPGIAQPRQSSAQINSPPNQAWLREAALPCSRSCGQPSMRLQDPKALGRRSEAKLESLKLSFPSHTSAKWQRSGPPAHSKPIRQGNAAEARFQPKAQPRAELELPGVPGIPMRRQQIDISPGPRSRTLAFETAQAFFASTLTRAKVSR